MALAQAASYVEKLLGHQDNATTAQNVSTPAKDRAKYGHPTETMKALTWQGKNTVKICTLENGLVVDAKSNADHVVVVEVPKPIIVEDRDVILKVTGSTICGSDLHLLHGISVSFIAGDSILIIVTRNCPRDGERRYSWPRVLRYH